MSGEQSAPSTLRFGTGGDDYVLPGQRFEFERYVEEWQPLLEHANHDAAEIERLRKEGDWTAMYRKGVKMTAEGTRRLHEHLRSQKRLNTEIQVVEEARDRYEDEGTRPVEDGDVDTEEIVSALKEQVDGEYRSALPDDETLAEWIESPGDAGALEVPHPSESAAATAFADRLREHRNLAIWYVTGGFETLFRADLYREIDGAAPEQRSDAAVEATERFFEEVETEVVGLLQEYYGALAAGDYDRLEGHVWRGTSFPFEVRDELVAVGAMLHRAREYERERSERGHERSAIAFAELQAELHRISRLLTLLLAASYWYLFVARQGDVHEEARAEVETARRTGFESLVVDGLDVDVDDLVESPEEYDGRLVETTGFVENVQYNPGESTGTSFEVVDVRHDCRVRVFSPYRHLRVWALRHGAFVHLNGEFTASSEYADGDPEIELDVVSVGGNSDDSWFDHVVNELGQDNMDIFSRYPSHTNAIWSLELPAGGDSE